MAIARAHSRRPRALAAALAGSVLTLTSLVACSSTGATSADSGTPTGTLHVLVSSADASDAAFKQLNADFEKAYPKVKVDFTASPNNAFNAARSSRLTAGNVDVTLAQPQQVPSYVKNGTESDDDLAADAGLFLDLSKEPFVKNFTPTVMDSLKYKGKTYTLPTGLSYYTGVFYNKSIFTKLGIEVPTTWTDFESDVAKIQASGVAALGIGGKDSWPAGLGMIAAVQGLYPTTADKQTLAQDIWTKKASLTASTQVEVLQRVKSLYDAAQKNFAGVAYSDIPAAFASGSIAMTVDGTWDQTTIDSAVNGAFDYGYFPLPASDNAADNKTLGGKVELRLAVAANTKNKTAALAYLKFYSQPSEYKKFVTTAGFAPAQPNIPASAFLKSIEPYTATFTPAWDTIWVANSKAGAAASFPFNYPAITPLGTMSVADAAKAAQSDWAAGS